MQQTFEDYLRANGFLKEGETMQQEFPIQATIKLYDSYLESVKDK